SVSLPVSLMVWPPVRVEAKVMVLLPAWAGALAASTAARKLPAPLSALVVTRNDDSTMRSSSASSRGRAVRTAATHPRRRQAESRRRQPDGVELRIGRGDERDVDWLMVIPPNAARADRDGSALAVCLVKKCARGSIL